MKLKDIGLRLSGIIFGAVAMIHLLRIITVIPVIVADMMVPIWMNVVGLAATSFLCGWLFWLAGRKDQK